MNKKRKIFGYTLLLVLLIGILLLLSPYLLSIVTKIGTSIQHRFQINVNWINSAELISASPRLQFKFSQKVDSQVVLSSFYTEPPTAGTWNWLSADQAIWQPDRSLKAGQMLRFGFRDEGNLIDPTNSKLKENAWQVFIREPEIVFLKGLVEGKELFKLAPALPGIEIQLTQTAGEIVDFTVSPDGEQVLFSRWNDQQGIDLWLMDRDGQGLSLLLDCGSDRCTEPDWNPVRDEIVFSKQTEPDTASSPNNEIQRPFLLNLRSRISTPLLKDDSKPGYDPVWSSRGQWISFWEGMERGIVILHASSREVGFSDPSAQDTGCWSPEERYFYYSDVNDEGLPIVSIIYQVDILTGLRDYFTGSDLFDLGYNYYYPVCHPDGQGLLSVVQVDPKIPQRELWWIQPDGAHQVISNDLSQMVTQYSWRPDGSQVLFLRDSLTGLADGSKMMLWDPDNGSELHELTDQVFKLHWLP